MNLWRRFALGIIMALVCVSAWDYGKHYYVLSILKKEEGVTLNNAHITLYRKGFRIHVPSLSYDAVNASDVRLRIPFFSVSRAIIWGRGLTVGEYFASEKVKIFLSLEDDVYRITHFYMKDNSLKILADPITNHHISGQGNVCDTNINYTVHATMLSSAGRDLSTFTSFGGISNPFDGRRKGELRFKLSHTHTILELLAQYQTLKGWQKDLLMQAFDEDVVIPIDIRGTYIYMGPLKLAEIS